MDDAPQQPESVVYFPSQTPVPYQSNDQYFYSADEVEAILLAGPSQYIDHLDRITDVERAFRWLCLEYPIGGHLVRAVIQGYELSELAKRLNVTAERIDQELLSCYTRMATWLNTQS